MEAVFESFLSWQFLFFCVAIGAVVSVIKQFVEYAMENWWPLKQWKIANKDAKLWRELILPIMPIILGQLAAIFIDQYPYPEEFSSKGGRLVFGLVGGFSSGLIVRLFKSFLSYKMNEYTTTTTTNTMTLTPTTTITTITPSAVTVDQNTENSNTDVQVVVNTNKENIDE